MTENSWRVYWDYIEYYKVSPNEKPRDPRDVLILVVNPEGHENGYDERTAQVCARTLTALQE